MMTYGMLQRPTRTWRRPSRTQRAQRQWAARPRPPRTGTRNPPPTCSTMDPPVPNPRLDPDPGRRNPPAHPPPPGNYPPKVAPVRSPFPRDSPSPGNFWGGGPPTPAPPRSHFFQGPWGKLGEQGGGMTRRRLPRKRPRVAVLRPRGNLRLRRQSWQGSGAWHHQVLRSRYQVFTRIKRRPWKTRSRRRSWTGRRRRPMRAGSS